MYVDTGCCFNYDKEIQDSKCVAFILIDSVQLFSLDGAGCLAEAQLSDAMSV